MVHIMVWFTNKISHDIRIKLILFYIFIHLAPQTIYGQDEEIVMKAAFIERFTRFIEWPDNSFDDTATFKILILNDQSFAKNMEILYATTKIKGKKVVVHNSDDYYTINNCQMVFLSSSCRKKLEEILEYSKKYNVLTIADTDGFCEKGVMINFFIEEDILRFEINTKEVKESNLKISNFLVNVAKHRIE